MLLAPLLAFLLILLALPGSLAAQGAFEALETESCAPLSLLRPNDPAPCSGVRLDQGEPLAQPARGRARVRVGTFRAAPGACAADQGRPAAYPARVRHRRWRRPGRIPQRVPGNSPSQLPRHVRRLVCASYLRWRRRQGRALRG